MLEILAMIWFSRKLGTIAKAKGRRPGGYWVLGVVSWFGGEVLGATAGATTGNQAAVYVFAIFGAIVCTVAAYTVVSNLAPLRAHQTSVKFVDDDPQPRAIMPPSAAAMR
jgi:outer membrane lipoprotein SlyB